MKTYFFKSVIEYLGVNKHSQDANYDRTFMIEQEKEYQEPKIGEYPKEQENIISFIISL